MNVMQPATTAQEEVTVASVRGLEVAFPIGDDWRTVVRGVDFDVHPGDRIALVGESGSGKTMVGSALLGITPATARVRGEISVAGIRPQVDNKRELRKLRGGIASMVFQDPLTSLNPVRTVGSQLTESIRRHQRMSKVEARARAIDVLKTVGVPVPTERLGVFPHELSGGLRQRVVIALAIANDPELLIADEPTTALDATIQAQILRVFSDTLKGQSMILVTHDLAVAAEVCNHVLVMYAGKIVERGPVDEILRSPKHPYTQGLLSAVPAFTSSRQPLRAISGSPPQDPGALSGCRFAPRCPLATKECVTDEPPEVENVACWHAERGDDR